MPARRGRGWVEIASCNAMNVEHWLRQRIGVLGGGGANERVTVKYISLHEDGRGW
jgi:hypothetical protein